MTLEKVADELVARFSGSTSVDPSIHKQILAALARAHAEGLEAGGLAGEARATRVALEAAEHVAVNEACALDEGDQYIKAAHRIADRIRSLIPAAPEVPAEPVEGK